jgi:hypothetical protein
MVKYYFLSVCLFTITHVKAQQWLGSPTSTGSIYRNGNIGINTDNPQSALDVKGNIQLSSPFLEKPMGLIPEVDDSYPSSSILNMSLNFRESNAITNSDGAGFRIDMRPTFPLFQWVKRNAGESITLGGEVLMGIGSNGNLGIGTGKTIPAARLHVVGDEFVTGKVGIGTNNFLQDADAKLIVDGKILAEDLEVKNVKADHVFAPTYKLRSLKEVEKYINDHGHLPDVPAASETEKGIKVAEFNTLLLQKIEELTLYVIQQRKEINTLKTRLANKRAGKSKSAVH